MTSSLVVAGLAISLALSAIESGPRRAAPQAGQRQPGDRRPTPWPRGEHPPRGQVADGIDQFRTQPVELASNVVIMSGRFATCSCPPADRWAKLFGTRRQPGHPLERRMHLGGRRPGGAASRPDARPIRRGDPAPAAAHQRRCRGSRRDRHPSLSRLTRMTTSRLPHKPTLHALVESATGFLTYLLSFVYLGIYWNNHHHFVPAC